MTEVHPEVLVVGAGPVGLLAAYALLRQGVRVRVVDAKNGPAVTSRAIATHPRTLEVYDQLGLAGRMLERGRRISAFTLYHNGTRLARLDADYAKMPTAYPFTLCIDQVHTEEVLRDAVAEAGVAVEWGVRLVSFDQDDSGVRAVLEHPDGRAEPIVVPWLIGCDGGHSTVRKHLGLALVGESVDTWLIADAQVRTDLPRNSIYWVRSGTLTMMMVPMSAPGAWRLLDTSWTDPDASPDEVARRFTEKLSAGLGRKIAVADPTWSSVFTFQQRMVTGMRVDRCLLAGDAAHVHSPASGQGMNTGLQEAHNLAWKVAMVQRGQAGADLLDSYSAERVPVGRALLSSTKTATFLVQLKNAAAGLALPVVFGVVRAIPRIRIAIQRKVLGGVSGLRLAYPDSPLTVTGAGPGASRGPAPGERVTATAVPGNSAERAALTERLRVPGWILLVRGSDTGALPSPSWLEVCPVGARPGLPDPDGELTSALGLDPGSWILVRPDGYVAARGTGVQRLGDVLGEYGFAAAAPPVTTQD
jgi:6-methylpretetramide 4-monooxygenase / 4-hydroxy-6-methylpretetramide 12a-monooxygenase